MFSRSGVVRTKISAVSLFKGTLLSVFMLLSVPSGATEQTLTANTQAGPLVLLEQSSEAKSASHEASPAWLGPVIAPANAPVSAGPTPSTLLGPVAPWTPVISPLLESLPLIAPNHAPLEASKEGAPEPSLAADKNTQSVPTETSKEDAKTPVVSSSTLPKIVILIDDLGYNRKGMQAALQLPSQVALAILPSTPFALKTAQVSQQQQRITLLHAPMENQRELKLGPGGLYAKMNEQELKSSLRKDIDSLPGISGVNNHMGSLLTTKQQSMNWVMETLKERSLFFIDSLTSPDSVAQQTAQQYGLRTVSRDVFLDNIRSEKAIDKQFNRLLKTARAQGVALAIGHPYPETMAYLQKRLQQLAGDGVQLAPLTDILIVPAATVAKVSH